MLYMQFTPKAPTPLQMTILYIIWQMEILEKRRDITRSTIAIKAKKKKTHISNIIHSICALDPSDTRRYIRKQSIYQTKKAEDKPIKRSAYFLNGDKFITCPRTSYIFLKLAEYRPKNAPIADFHISRQEFVQSLLDSTTFLSEEFINWKLDWGSRPDVFYSYSRENIPDYIAAGERIFCEKPYLELLVKKHLFEEQSNTNIQTNRENPQ